MPTDPVLVMQGTQIEAARRNGSQPVIAVRTESELITQLEVSDAAVHATAVLTPADAAGPVAPAGIPAAAGPAVMSALLGEAALLSPQSAGLLAAVLSGHGFTGSAADLTSAVQGCQGGTSPLGAGPPGAGQADGGSDGSAPAGGGLFAASRAADLAASKGGSPFAGPQPAQEVTALRVVFANPASAALAPNSVGWSAQVTYPELAGHADPFLPLWLTWQVATWPLDRHGEDQYPPALISGSFGFDERGIDLSYPVINGAPPDGLITPRTSAVTSMGATMLSPKALGSLTDQIGRFIADFAKDKADLELTQAKDAYDAWPVLSQAIGTFNLGQTLRAPIPMITVADLLDSQDTVTTDLAAAAIADTSDSWYAASFNALAPQTGGNAFFAPLRGGFLEVKQLTIIDAFGQVMTVDTTEHTAQGNLAAMPSQALTPPSGDAANAGSVYLPPRVLTPARVEARWLSASYDASVPGITGDFADPSSRPAASPVCGWIVPNHLDVTLAFYDADGSPIGSFGVEQGAVKYRTRAGNTRLPADDLDRDIASVNPHVARLMTFVARQDQRFLEDLMTGIADSDAFIAPAGAVQDPSLAVLIGRPLAITRATLAMTTAGRAVPPSQLTTALKASVDAGWTRYADRQQNTSAGLLEVAFPARIGHLIDIDDGLVAFLPEADDGSYASAYLPAAPPGLAGNLQQPGPATTQLRLNAAAQVFTLIVDPRAPVHVSTGVLPAAELAIPPEQYSAALRTLAVTFVTHPVLSESRGLKLAVPQVAGFSWAWIAPSAAPAPLAGAGDAGRPSYGYTPQSVAEGWLQLGPNPEPAQAQSGKAGPGEGHDGN
jgi:hypothetical protein